LWILVLMSHAGLSSAERVSPRRLLEVVDIGAPVVSTDGSAVAFRVEQASVERNTYDSAWYVQSLEGTSSPRRVADGGVPLRDSAGGSLPAMARWSPDGRWIYFLARLDERVDVWRAAADGSAAEPLTHDPADVRDWMLSDDGNSLFYSVGATREAVQMAEQADYDGGTHIDKNVPIGQGLFRSGNIDGRLSTQRFTGLWFDRSGLLAGVPDHWKSIELGTRLTRDLATARRPSRELLPSDLPAQLATPWKLVAEPNGRRVALLTRTGDATGLQEKPDVELSVLPDKRAVRATRCVDDLCAGKAITSIQWRPGSDDVLFTVTDPEEGLAQLIFSWDVRTGGVRQITRSRGLLNGGRSGASVCGLSEGVLVCVASEADKPPWLEKVDIATGERQVLFDPNAALAEDIAKTTPAALLKWTDAKGRQFTGQFFEGRGAGGGRRPLFVSYYLCQGFLRGGVGDEWPFATLAEQGISSLCINSPRAFTLDAVARYGQGLSAVESIVDLLVEEDKVDPAKIGMGGLSFGSEVTLWTAMETDRLAAASVTSPVISPNYYLFSGLKGDAFTDGLNEAWGLGAPGDTPERWRMLSPTENLSRFGAPILFQMPEQEYIYALDYAIPLMQRSLADMYVFANEPHQKFQPRHKLSAYIRNVDWFRFWLQDYEDPDPSKASQYVRWREMRQRAAERVRDANYVEPPS
jgi:dipeptidyl aminopeptidase/acylaminoacyl peptidase